MPVDTINVKDAAGATREVRAIPATYPVTADVLPLPSGAATETKQDSGIAATQALAPATLGASSDVSFTDASAQSGALTGALIRVVAKDAACRIAIAADPTATATDTLIMEGQVEYFAITSGHKVAAIRDDTTDGTLNITVAG